MAKEIERKFLIDAAHPEVCALLATQPVNIRQGYMKSDETGVVRIRITDEEAFLTIKGVTKGISRDEFEYEIPQSDAEHMLAHMCPKPLIKQRYKLALPCGHTAEIDVFPQIGLMLAEIELDHQDEEFSKPEWFGSEVSHDPAYYNNNIIDRIPEK